MRRLSFGIVLVIAAMLTVMISTTSANEGTLKLKANLTGFQETPAILTTGTGTFTGTIVGGHLTYTLTFSPLSSPAFVSHIHFGQRSVAGGVAVFLCGGGGTPACPAGGGTVSGTAQAASVVGPTSQGLMAGDFTGLIAIIRSGNAYVNVHTSNHPGGEIRGQVQVESED
jgi:hypothetical protein